MALDSKIHVIETPEHIRFRYTLAPLGARLTAYIIDSIIQVVLTIAVLLILSLLAITPLSNMNPEDGLNFMIMVQLIMMFLFQWVYYIFFEFILDGRTPGKKFTKLRVIQGDGGPIDFPTIALRNLLRGIDHIPMVPLVGGLVALINKENKRLGDLVANTLVVHDEEPSLLRPPQGIKLPPQCRFIIAGKKHLSQRQLSIVENTLLYSGPQGPAGAQLLEKLAREAALAMGVEYGGEVPPRIFLEEVFRFHALPNEN